MTTILSKTADKAISGFIEDNNHFKTIVIIMVVLAIIFALGKAMRVVGITVSEYKQLMRVLET